MLTMENQKRFYNKETDFTITFDASPSTLSKLANIPELRNGLLILVVKKGRGMKEIRCNS